MKTPSVRLLLWACLCLIPLTLVRGERTPEEHLQRIVGQSDDLADWRWAVRQLGDANARRFLREAMAERKEYPRQELVTLLDDPLLATRLGALELLEQAVGDTLGFNPWLEPRPESTSPNAEPLTRWQEWAQLEGTVDNQKAALPEEQLQAYLRDLISGNRDRQRRAVRMLDPVSLDAVAAIQTFISENLGLPRASYFSLKAAQYELVLNRSTPKTAGILARDLTRGNRDQKLGALSSLKKAGFLAIPIIRDFIEDPDDLIRETAIDSILELGGAQVVPLVSPILAEEKDVNVLHAAMRRFRDIGGKEAIDLSASFLDHEDEDMLVSALATLAKLTGKKKRHSSDEVEKVAATAEQKGRALALLKDPRWRVRTAALSYVAKTRDASAGEEVIRLLNDEDSFVRSHAIEAVVALKLTEAKPALEKLFLEDPEMVGPVTSAFTSMKQVLSDELIAHLDEQTPDTIVAAIDGLDRDDEKFLKRVSRYATHQNLDVACTALRSLADDSDKVKFAFVADHLNGALQSGQADKISAVLSALRFPEPRSSSSSYSLEDLISEALIPEGETSLDGLYEAFLGPSEKVSLAEADEPAATGGLAALQKTLEGIAGSWDSEKPWSYQAGLILAKADLSVGYEILDQHFAQFTTSQRAAIAEGLDEPSHQTAIPLVLKLLKDEISEIRRDVASNAVDDDSHQDLLRALLKELDRPNSPLTGAEVYSWSLEYTLKDASRSRMLLKWARDALSSSIPDDRKILALVLLRSQLTEEDEVLLSSYTRSPNHWLRRAAWYALAKSRPNWLLDHEEELLAESSVPVRLAVPIGLVDGPEIWVHHFTDLEKKKNQSSRSYSSRRSRRAILSEGHERLLRKLAEDDLSPQVRFASLFALMTHRREINLPAFIELIPLQPKEARVSYRLGEHIEKNYRSMGKGMKALLAYVDVKKFASSKRPAILAHFAEGSSGPSFNNFASLAKATEVGEGPQQLEGVETPDEIAQRRENLKVIVFYKPGCKECEKAEAYLEDLKSQFPLMELERLNILDQDHILINQVLCDRLQVSGVGKTPAFFTQVGAAIAPKVKPQDLAGLLASTMESEDDPDWADFEEAEMIEAEKKVEENFSKITLAIVILGGLFDGVNPCAFATIIFFLSYLQVAKRTPREILMVGISFILAIFLAYFSVGLVFHAAIEKLVEMEGFQWARSIMTWVFAFFALLVAVLSLRDGIRASRGSLKEMTLQLPDFLKNRIRGTIRKRARTKNYVIAAFVTGIIISFLELACTGQVYAPIVYQIQQGRADAVLYLLIYNIAFILPLVIIFFLAYRGMASDALVRFQKNHTAAVKYATAALFFLLTVVILFGDRFLPHA